MSETKPKRPMLVKGVNGETIEIPRFYLNPKARPERKRVNSLSKEGRQVYDAIELGTMAYKQETAVITVLDAEGNRLRRLMTVGDIARLTKLPDSQVRRAFRDELEPQDLAHRVAIDGTGVLRKGNVKIVSRAEPAVPSASSYAREEDQKGGRAGAPSPSWVPDSWDALKSFARRERREFPAEIEDARVLIPEGEEIARDLEKVQLRARAFMDRLRAQSIPAAIKEKKERERNERTKDAAPATIQAFPAAPVRSSPPLLRSGKASGPSSPNSPAASDC